jgi:hypothetical protein
MHGRSACPPHIAEVSPNRRLLVEILGDANDSSVRMTV